MNQHSLTTRDSLLDQRPHQLPKLHISKSSMNLLHSLSAPPLLPTHTSLLITIFYHLTQALNSYWSKGHSSHPSTAPKSEKDFMLGQRSLARNLGQKTIRPKRKQKPRIKTLLNKDKWKNIINQIYNYHKSSCIDTNAKQNQQFSGQHVTFRAHTSYYSKL